MKKILLVISLMMSCLLTGCQSQISAKTFMLTKDDTLYALYNTDGEKITDYLFTNYTQVGNDGYIVTNSDGQVGYIDNKGKQVIDFGEYETLESTDEMLYATKKVKKKKTTTKKKTSTKKTTTKKTEETEITPKANYVNSNLYVLNLDGEVLYTASKSTTILKAAVPVIYDVENETYMILHDSGDVVDESEDQVLSVSIYDNGDGIMVNYETISLFYDFFNEDVEVVTITTPGSYEILEQDEINDKSAVAYDASQHILVYLNMSSEHAKVVKDIEVEGAYYDDNDNLICYMGETKYLLNSSGASLITSYYHSSDTYILRSEDVYGPHTLYNDGEKTNQLDNCQVYPKAYYVEGNLYPVYFRKKGYKYYDFNGDLAFDYTYEEATPFDLNGIAIVKNNGAYYLIDKTGKEITTAEYSNIVSIGKSYYVGYNEQGMFAVIDNTGKEVLPMGYTLLPETPVFYRNNIKYLLFSKNGRSYLYDADNDMKEVWSIEGNVEYNSLGYFVGNYQYYTFEGEQIQ